MMEVWKFYFLDMMIWFMFGIPFSEEELEGWPIDMGSNSLTGPITADLDNDGDLEVIAAIKSGTVYVLHHDGSPFLVFQQIYLVQ